MSEEELVEDFQASQLLWNRDSARAMFLEHGLWPSFIGVSRDRVRDSAGKQPVLLWPEQQRYLADKMAQQDDLMHADNANKSICNGVSYSNCNNSSSSGSGIAPQSVGLVGATTSGFTKDVEASEQHQLISNSSEEVTDAVEQSNKDDNSSSNSRKRKFLDAVDNSSNSAERSSATGELRTQGTGNSADEPKASKRTRLGYFVSVFATIYTTISRLVSFLPTASSDGNSDGNQEVSMESVGNDNTESEVDRSINSSRTSAMKPDGINNFSESVTRNIESSSHMLANSEKTVTNVVNSNQSFEKSKTDERESSDENVVIPEDITELQNNQGVKTDIPLVRLLSDIKKSSSTNYEPTGSHSGEKSSAQISYEQYWKEFVVCSKCANAANEANATDSQKLNINDDACSKKDVVSSLVNGLENNIDQPKVNESIETIEERGSTIHHASETRQAVFNALQSRGYFIGPGDAYGGDYSVYSGSDPSASHSIATVRVLENNYDRYQRGPDDLVPDIDNTCRLCGGVKENPLISVKDLLSFARVQNQVAKTAVYAFQENILAVPQPMGTVEAINNSDGTINSVKVNRTVRCVAFDFKGVASRD